MFLLNLHATMLVLDFSKVLIIDSRRPGLHLETGPLLVYEYDAMALAPYRPLANTTTQSSAFLLSQTVQLRLANKLN